MSFVPRSTVLLLLLLWLVGCGGAGNSGSEPGEIAAIEGESSRLAAERRALAALVLQLGSARTARRDTSLLERQVATQRSELGRLAGQLDQHLVDYLNTHRPVAGRPLGADQRRVLDVKITEDLAVAAEFIAEGGDYSHAIQIYQELLTLDPANAAVRSALASSEAHRTMSPEHFATLRKGMSRDQVRAALGMPHLKNIQVFEEQGVLAWFYPTTTGGIAGVYFQAEDEAEPLVYRWDFAVQAPAG